MKKLLLFVLLMSVITFNSYAQIDEFLCTTEPEFVWSGQVGGLYKTSEGTIRVLFVFAQFPDDNYDINNVTWPKGQAPADMQSWVDNTWSATPTQGSMTHYFNDMSFNKLKFIGKTVSVITQQTRAWYLANNKKRGDIHTEIIQQLDQTWDFAQFDNWDYEGNYNHKNQPDGIVDMVFMVWRNIANEFIPDSIALIYERLSMGRVADLGGGPAVTVDNGYRAVNMGYGGNGSGVTLTDWFTENMFRFSIHEFGHYLQGGNDQHVGYGFWGLCSGWGIKNFVPNSFERYRLGWINLNTVQASPNGTISSATLPDYVTSGVAYRLVINDAAKQYFYIENHQKTSFWENNQMFLRSPYGNVENGIYILRQDGAGGNNKFIRCLAADGRYNWTVNQIIQSPWHAQTLLLPVFKMLNPDRVNGYTDLDWIPWWWNGVYQDEAAILFTENSNGEPIEDIRNHGDGKDAFRIGYNEVWSPYSNPNSQRLNKDVTPFGFKINSFNYGVASLDIYVGTSLDGPPSKPQNLTVTASSTNHPLLTWEPNLEPDKSYYKVYKYNMSGTGWEFLANTTSTSYHDISVSYCQPGQICPERNIKYRVTCVDTQNKESIPSNEVITSVKGFGIEKAVDNQGFMNAPDDYNLAANYPNPFNPGTIINYAVKEAGLVKLNVYDILGAEVAELVNEVKEAGYHSVEFNAATLPSGVYIYTMQVNGFTSSKKMLLMK
ncbi:MAG: T9SS type A sorting domain-containing protein [Ignavibacteriaceae bacterium]|jgi:M6 family metalloprotease-like protein|nr:T9SS type A sorting domain-containing protein [Ignavibacteriaceae bacterium]